MERICHRTADQYGPWGNGIQRSNMGSVYFLAYRNYQAGANSFTGIVKKLKIVTM